MGLTNGKTTMSSKYMNVGPKFLTFRFRLVSPYRTRQIFTFQSFESPGKYRSTLAMFAFVDPPESVTNTMPLKSRYGGTRPTKWRFPVLCKCMSKGTILYTMRLLKWRERIVHVWRTTVSFAEQSHRLKSTLYVLVTANIISTASTVDPWFKTITEKLGG